MATTSTTISNLSSTFPLSNHLPSFSAHNHKNPLPISLPFPYSPPPTTLCRAAKPQNGPVKRRPSPADNKKRKKSGGRGQSSNSKALTLRRDIDFEDDEPSSGSQKGYSGYHPTPLPNPPAGFVVDDEGRVLMAATKRLITLVEPATNKSLECVIRRVFRSSRGDECVLVCPVDMPISVLKNNVDGWAFITDEEVEAVLPATAYALAKIHMHLVYSGFCYTARGGFCYSLEDIFDITSTDEGVDTKGIPDEGMEVTCFYMDGAFYMVYTPSDPLLFVAVKDQNGVFQLADDDLLEDPAIASAVDEETEFNALAEEEENALLDAMVGGL